MLSLEGVSVRYGGLAALTGVSIHVDAGEFVTIIGPNGAGKTTLFKAISGIVPLAAGTLRFEGADLSQVPAPRRAHLGIAHVPEHRQVFSRLTVSENLELGATASRATREERERAHAFALELFPVLRERADQLAGTLSGGEQQMLAIARGLLASPKLLLLDEPSTGLAPAIVDQIFDRIQRIRREFNTTLVLVEQRAVDALALCDRAYVLATGQVTASGKGADLMRNDAVQQAYLGR